MINVSSVGWYKIISMPLSRYPKKLFLEDWIIKPRPGQQHKVWKILVDYMFESREWVENSSKVETFIF